MSLTAGLRGTVHPIRYHEFPEGDFQVRHHRYVECRLKYNIKIKYIIQSDRTLYFVKLY